MIMPLAEPKTEMATSIDIKDPAQGPRAALVASMATTPDVFTTAMATIDLGVMDKPFSEGIIAREFQGKL